MKAMRIEEKVMVLATTIANKLAVDVHYAGFDAELDLYNLAVKQTDKYLQPEFKKATFQLIQESGLENIAIICNPALFRNEYAIFKWESDDDSGSLWNSFSPNMELATINRNEKVFSNRSDWQNNLNGSAGEFVLVTPAPLAA